MDTTQAPDDVMASIADGLVGGAERLTGGVWTDVASVRRNDQGWPSHLVAARVGGAGGGAVGVWAVSVDDAGVGPVFGVNPIARAMTTWGSATDPDSPPATAIERLVNYPEAFAVAGAVE